MSQKQAKANKRNAQHSTGPRSATGKQRSSENALKHGLNVPFEAVNDPRFDRLSGYLLADGYSPDHRAQQLAAAILNHRRVMEVLPTHYQMPKEVFGLAEIEMIEEIESQEEFGMRTLTKKDRQTIASFLRRFERVNQRLGSEVEQRVKRLASLARYQQKSVAQLAKLIHKE